MPEGTPPVSPPSPDLQGKRFVVTGASAGIGLATASDLARRGATLTLANRSEEKTRPVIDSLRRESGNERIDFVRLDLAELASVREAAAKLLARDEPVHVLINNAGVGGQRGLTADGFELQFGINHLGHFLFTYLLLDRLRASAPARIVTVASKAHYRATGIDFEAVRRPTRTFVGMHEYSVSKLANVLFSAELARRLEGTGVTTYSLHPGVIASDIWRRAPGPIRAIAKLFMKSIEEGARTTLYCATSPEAASETGLYYDECRARRPGRAARDAELAAELWRRSAEWCGVAPGGAGSD